MSYLTSHVFLSLTVLYRTSPLTHTGEEPAEFIRTEAEHMNPLFAQSVFGIINGVLCKQGRQERFVAGYDMAGNIRPDFLVITPDRGKQLGYLASYIAGEGKVNRFPVL